MKQFSLWIILASLCGFLFAACSAPEPEKKCTNEKSAYKTTFIPGDPCFTREAALNVENVSSADKGNSHNFGMNCMQCHQDNGPGLGVFKVGGSIKMNGTPHAGATIKIFSDPARKSLAMELKSDKLGNFYSTIKDKLDMPAKAYFVSVVSADGKTTKVMRGPKASGACNQCHDAGFPITLDK